MHIIFGPAILEYAEVSGSTHPVSPAGLFFPDSISRPLFVPASPRVQYALISVSEISRAGGEKVSSAPIF